MTPPKSVLSRQTEKDRSVEDYQLLINLHKHAKKMRNMMLSGLKVRYTMSALKGG